MNQIRDDLDDAVSQQDFMKAQTLKTSLDQLEVEQAQLQDDLEQLGGAATHHPTPAHVDQPVQLDLSDVDVPDNPQVTHKCLKLLVATLQVRKTNIYLCLLNTSDAADE